MKLHGPPIRIKRLELGMTLSDVSRATGIDVSDLSKVERGQLPGLGMQRAKALSEYLNIPLIEIAPELAELIQQASP